MTTILFVRHGESDANTFIHKNPNDPHLEMKINSIPDPQLTEIGKLQANCVGLFLADKLKGKHVHLITSLFTRTIQTSEPFHNLHKEFIKIYDNDPLLQEYNRPGKHQTEGGKIFKTHHTWKSFTDDVETFVDVLENITNSDFQASLQNDNSTTPIVIFGHSLFLSVMLSYIGSSKTMTPDQSQLIFKSPNCSITTLNYSQGTWKIYNVNSIAHLPNELVTGTECPFGK